MQPDSRFPTLAGYLRSLKLNDNEVFNATVAAADDAGLPRLAARKTQGPEPILFEEMRAAGGRPSVDPYITASWQSAADRARR